jgi:hypothetical protein
MRGVDEGREYLADEFSLADAVHAGNFVRMRELEEGERSPPMRTPTWGDLGGTPRGPREIQSGGIEESFERLAGRGRPGDYLAAPFGVVAGLDAVEVVP